MQAVEEKPQLAAEGKDPASDEEIARRLQQQLNGEAAAAARRRTRKQPTFYSPQVLICFIAPAALVAQEGPPPSHHWVGLCSAEAHSQLQGIGVSAHVCNSPHQAVARFCALACPPLCSRALIGEALLDRRSGLLVLQQSGGYSGYHGVEYASMEGEGREGEDAPEAEQAAGACQAVRRPEAEVAMPASPSARRGQLGASSPVRCHTFVAVRHHPGESVPMTSPELQTGAPNTLERAHPWSLPLT